MLQYTICPDIKLLNAWIDNNKNNYDSFYSNVVIFFESKWF